MLNVKASGDGSTISQSSHRGWMTSWWRGYSDWATCGNVEEQQEGTSPLNLSWQLIVFQNNVYLQYYIFWQYSQTAKREKFKFLRNKWIRTKDLWQMSSKKKKKKSE